MTNIDTRLQEAQQRRAAAMQAEQERIEREQANQRTIEQADAEIAVLRHEALFPQFEAAAKGQFEHYTELAARDAKIKQLQEQLQELVQDRADFHAGNQVPGARYINLYTSLNQNATPEQRERRNAIVKQYRVEGYFG